MKVQDSRQMPTPGNLRRALAARSLKLCLGFSMAVGASMSVHSNAHAAAKKKNAPALQAISCELWAVHASKAKSKKAQDRVPSALSALRRELLDDQFAAYGSFHLLEQKSLRVPGNRSGQQSFRAGYTMQLQLVQALKNRLKVRVKLARKGASNLVNLDYWMGSGDLLMLVGGSYKDGKIVFATRCRASS